MSTIKVEPIGEGDAKLPSGLVITKKGTEVEKTVEISRALRFGDIQEVIPKAETKKKDKESK